MAKPKKTKKKKKAKGKGLSLKAQIFMIAGMCLATLFLPTTFLIFIGMLPTPLALLVDKSRQKTKVIAVGAMNMAGCSPFLLKLWHHGNDFESAFDIIMNVKTIIIIYSAAAIGYLINWSMTGLVAGILYDRGKKRQVAIKKRQEELVERWGTAVTGKIPLDPDGFPIESNN